MGVACGEAALDQIIDCAPAVAGEVALDCNGEAASANGTHMLAPIALNSSAPTASA